MTRGEAIEILAMFLHKQCDLKRTKFAYDANTVWDAVKMAKEALEEQPVKCKECTYIKEAGGHANCDGYLLCKKWHRAVDAEDYCSWGKEEP